jgi:rRNA-processing protein FCF1
MRHGRAKAARRTLQFFARTVQLKPPYRVLVDATLAVALVRFQIPLHERVDKLLQHAPVIWLTTAGALHELEQLQHKVSLQLKSKSSNAKNSVEKKHVSKKGPSSEPKSDPHEQLQWFQAAHAWVTQHCQEVLHLPEISTTDGEESTSKYAHLSVVAQQIVHHTTTSNVWTASSTISESASPIVVASQDPDLLDALREQGTVPIIRLARGTVLLLEQPSASATRQAQRLEQGKWTPSLVVTLNEQAWASQVRTLQKEQQQQKPIVPERRRKRKAQGPNPLSCKKTDRKPRKRMKSTSAV